MIAKMGAHHPILNGGVTMADDIVEPKNEGQETEIGNIEAIKGITLLPALTSLLNPTAEYLGQEMKGGVQHFIENWKERWKAKNLQDHIDEVKIRLEAEDPDHSFDQEKINPDQFMRWAEGAQNVKADDSYLSAMWQDLLKIIAEGEVIETTLLDTLQQLSPLEAQFLMFWDHEDHDENPLLRGVNVGKVEKNDRYTLSRLAILGIIQKQVPIRLIKRSLLHLMIISCVVITYVVIVSPAMASFIDVFSIMITIFILALSFGFFIPIVNSWVKYFLSPYELSWVGEKLKDAAWNTVIARRKHAGSQKA